VGLLQWFGLHIQRSSSPETPAQFRGRILRSGKQGPRRIAGTHQILAGSSSTAGPVAARFTHRPPRQLLQRRGKAIEIREVVLGAGWVWWCRKAQRHGQWCPPSSTRWPSRAKQFAGLRLRRVSTVVP